MRMTRALPFQAAIAALLFGASAAPAATPMFDPLNLDPTVKACDGFYQYVNGGWLKRNPIPGSAQDWSSFDQMRGDSLARLQSLVEGLGPNDGSPGATAIATFYRSGIDPVAVEAQGLGPVKDLLDKIDRIRKPKQFMPVLRELHTAGLPILFELRAVDDLDKPDAIRADLEPRGIGLPDRDYYLEVAAGPVRDAYRDYLERLLTLVGRPDARAEAAAVLAFETALAPTMPSLVEMRDPRLGYQPEPIRGLSAKYPHLDLAGYLKSQRAGSADTLSVAPAAYFAKLDELVETTPVATLQAVLRAQVLDAVAPYLGREYQSVHERLHRRLLQGEIEPRSRWADVLAATQAALPDALGRMYAEAALPEPARAEAQAIGASVLAAMKARVAQATWLGAAAKSEAQKKLGGLTLAIAPLPDRSEALPTLGPHYAGNVLAAAAHHRLRDLATIGSKRAPKVAVAPTTVDVYYDALQNRLVVPVGFLAPPVFAADAAPGLNAGAFGSVVAQQLMHAVTGVGQGIAADGSLRGWWTPPDQLAWDQRIAPLIEQYGAFEIISGIRVDGRRTLPENAADLGGLEVSWLAFAQRFPEQVAPTAPKGADGLTPAQRFFVGWAQLWRRQMRPEAMPVEAQISVQAPERYRVDGPLAHLSSFAEAYACKPGSGLARNPGDRVSIW